MFAKLIIALIITATCSPVATGRLNTTFLQEKKAMSDTIQTKQCSKCKKVLPISEFHKRRSHKDGLRSWCKLCREQLATKYYQDHKADYQQYQQTHKELHRRSAKRYTKTLKGHLMNVWHNMLHRCNNPKCKSYKNYGKRGIKVKFCTFERFFDYVVNDLKVEPRGLTIDRIDNDGHYERGNIRFVSIVDNNRNR